MLEFALGWSLLWLAVSGVCQFGYGYFAYNVLATSVASAARTASRMEYDVSRRGAFEERLGRLAVYGESGSRALLPNLSPANIQVAVTLDSAGMPREVTISATYDVEAMFTTFHLAGKPRSSVVYQGRVTCSGC